MSTSARPYVQMAGGYEAAIQAAQQGQQGQQAVTQLGAPTQINPEGQGPLIQQPVYPWQRQPVPSQVQQQQVQTQQQQQQPMRQPTPQEIMSGQMQQVPQQQVPQQQMVQPQQQINPADLNARLVGQNIPAELQGRSVGELIGIANGLRQVHLQTLQGQQSQPQVQTQQPQMQQQQPQVQQQGTAQQFDWRNPHTAIGEVVRNELQGVKQEFAQMMAPVIQAQNVNSAQQARNAAASQVPGFAQIEPLVLQRLQGVNPQALLNPSTWETAAKVVLGELAMQQLQQGQQPQQQRPYGVFAQQTVQPGQNPLPNMNTFFSEQPMQGGPVNGSIQLTPLQAGAAAAMGMSPADYIAWGGGVRR